MSRNLSVDWRAVVRQLWIGITIAIIMLVSTPLIMWYEYVLGDFFEGWTFVEVLWASIIGVGALVVAVVWAVAEYCRSSVQVDPGAVVIRYGPNKYTIRHDPSHPLVLKLDSTGRYWHIIHADSEAPLVRLPVRLFPSLGEFLNEDDEQP